MLVKSYEILPARHGKALFLRFCKVSIEQLFDNLESVKSLNPGVI